MPYQASLRRYKKDPSEINFELFKLAYEQYAHGICMRRKICLVYCPECPYSHVVRMSITELKIMESTNGAN